MGDIADDLYERMDAGERGYPNRTEMYITGIMNGLRRQAETQKERSKPVQEIDFMTGEPIKKQLTQGDLFT